MAGLERPFRNLARTQNRFVSRAGGRGGAEEAWLHVRAYTEPAQARTQADQHRHTPDAAGAVKAAQAAQGHGGRSALGAEAAADAAAAAAAGEVPEEVRCAVVWLHGYGSHVSRPTIHALGMELRRRGVAFLAYDQRGHGFSDGERALIEGFDGFVEDALAFVQAFLGTVDEDKQEFVLEAPDVSPGTRARLRQVPFMILSQSMGCAIGAMAANSILGGALDGVDATLKDRFIGQVFLSPAFDFNVPALPVRLLLTNVLAPMLASRELPDFLATTMDETTTWRDPEYRDYVMNDLHDPSLPRSDQIDPSQTVAEGEEPPRVDGLGPTRNMRWRSAASFIQLKYTMDDVIPHTAYHFKILHDPEDRITSYAGSQRFMRESQTAEENKELVDIPEGLHDLLSNERETVIEHIAGFIDTHLQQAT